MYYFECHNIVKNSQNTSYRFSVFVVLHQERKMINSSQAKASNEKIVFLNGGKTQNEKSA